MKKWELKDLAQKAKTLQKKYTKVKAADYDKLEEKKKQRTQPPPETKKMIYQ